MFAVRKTCSTTTKLTSCTYIKSFIAHTYGIKKRLPLLGTKLVCVSATMRLNVCNHVLFKCIPCCKHTFATIAVILLIFLLFMIIFNHFHFTNNKRKTYITYIQALDIHFVTHSFNLFYEICTCKHNDYDHKLTKLLLLHTHKDYDPIKEEHLLNHKYKGTNTKKYKKRYLLPKDKNHHNHLQLLIVSLFGMNKKKTHTHTHLLAFRFVSVGRHPHFY